MKLAVLFIVLVVAVTVTTIAAVKLAPPVGIFLTCVLAFGAIRTVFLVHWR